MRIPASDALPFRADKLGFLLRRAQEADVAELRLGRKRTYLLSDPEDIRHVLVTEEPRFPKHPRLVESAEPRLFGEGLVGSPENTHRQRRLSLQPAFDGRKLQPLSDVVLECADHFLDTWAAREDVDVVEASIALAHRVRMRTLLGDGSDTIAGELAEALAARQRYIEQVFVSPLPSADRLPSRRRYRYRRAQRSLEQLLLERIDERRREGGPDGDLLERMLELRDEDGAPLDDTRVFDEARGFLASYELSARALAWTLLLLAEHPEAQSRIAAQDDGDLVGYVQAVYSEALRLFPPTWLFVRIAPTVVELPSGMVVPARSRLFLCAFATQRDPRWFPDPDSFDPERFRPGAAPRPRPKYTYFPFGGGRHVCIGEGFVRLEAALVLTRLARRFELTRVGTRRAVPFPGATLEPRGDTRVRIRAR